MVDSYVKFVTQAFPLTMKEGDVTTNLIEDGVKLIVKDSASQLQTIGGKFGNGCLMAQDTQHYAMFDRTVYSGGGDFTLECHVRFDAFSETYQSFIGTGSAEDNGNANGTMTMKSGVPMIWYQWEALLHPTKITLDRFYHVALERCNGMLELYIDGVPTGAPISVPNVSFAYRYLGTDYYNKSTLGALNNVRMTFGVARYKGTFIPSSDEFLKTDYPSQSQPLPDQGEDPLKLFVAAHFPLMKTADFAFGLNYGYAALSLNIPESSKQIFKTGGMFGTGFLLCSGAVNRLAEIRPAIATGNGDFTIEAWVSFENIPGVSFQTIFGTDNGDRGLVAIYNQVMGIFMRPTHYCTSTGLVPGKNYHIALERFNGLLNVYVNGVAGSTPVRTDESFNYRFIGNDIYQDSAQARIMDARFTIGAARYKENFTPSGRIATEAQIRTSVSINLTRLKTAPVVNTIELKSCVSKKMLFDAISGGSGQIIGTTQVKSNPNFPVSRRVRLYRDIDGRLAREVWSNANGVYAFKGIDPKLKYTVVSYDHLHDFKATIADNLTPDVLT